MTDLVLLRAANLLTWGLMTIYMAGGAWSALFGRVKRRGDAMRLGCFLTGIVMVGFNIRWMFFPTCIWLWEVLYALGAATGVYILWLGRTYGRGEHV